MKNRRIPNFIMFALMLAFFGVWSLPNVASAVFPIPTGPKTLGNGAVVPGADLTPDYYTTANWANSPQIAKFVDTLPSLNSINNLGQMLPVAVPDTLTYPGSDYYIIAVKQYTEKMHSDLQPTTLRGYVQVNADGSNKYGAPHYLGPVIVAKRDRPVRLLFKNMLPTGVDGNLFIPVDKSVMGAGTGPALANGDPCNNAPLGNACESYTENRADIHLHGGRTPWISDGTPHQWIIPAGDYVNTPFKQGVSMQNVPDMPAPGDGESTYYFTNQQSARLMFYHDHAFGITRLNVYAGEAAGYVITDAHEQDLIDRGLIPGLKSDGTTVVMGGQIPLVIQDKTFVDATATTKYIYNPVTGLFDTPITVPKVRETDPLWNWGGDSTRQVVDGVRTPVTGDLWLPHVYMPAQNSIAGAGGVNPFGRWMYGPWFYPPTVVEVGPKANPYYDERCSSANPLILADCETPGQPMQIPGTPNVSMGMEAFQDSVVVNGTAFPTLTVDPKAYRFRILNAASDRFQNLSFYIADGTAGNVSLDGRLPAGATASEVTHGNGVVALKHNRTEVKMALASPALAALNNWPADWPVDGRPEMVPDPGLCAPGGVNCPNFGPNFLQIATEGGFLPQPVVITPQPVTYITDPTAFWVGVVDKTGLALGPAERADVIVDFSAYRGKTLLLYNDAPAAWPARVPGYDYYTKSPDMRDSGGFGTGGIFNQETGAWEGGTGSLPGKAPNTRTVMQVIVRDIAPTVFNSAPLEAEFKAGAPVVNTATYQNPAPTKTLFERSQEPIIVGQAAYAEAYPNSYFPANFPWEGINQMNDHFLDFVTIKGAQVHAITEPKGIHDEMGASFDPIYGRMSGNLAMQIPNPTTLTANLILYGFSDVPTEYVNNSVDYDVKVLPGVDGKPGTLGDGTQIWKISHNGVDTHPIHFHIFDVQLINRVGWDGQIALPNLNELGWKDTVKISPLMDTIVAVRPRAPALPFGIPESFRPLNPALPIDTTMGFNSIDPVTGQAYVAPSPYAGGVTNTIHNFGWEYVWHCHILSHEEMDMMRPIVLNYVAELPPAFTATKAANAINWNDPTSFPAITGVPADPEAYRVTTASSEIGYNVYQSELDGITFTPVAGKIVPINTTMIPANSTTYPVAGALASTRSYIVEAFNAKGSTFAIADATNFTITATLAATGGSSFATGTLIPLVVTPVGLPVNMTVKEVVFYDGSNIIATVVGGALTTDWDTDIANNPNAVVGLHTLSARIRFFLGNDVVTAPVTVNITGALAADFTPNGGTVAKCDVIPFNSGASTIPVGGTTGYSWLINGKNFNTATVNATLPPGTNLVTLGLINTNGAVVLTDQITKSFTVTGTNNAPTVTSTGGPYTVSPGGSLTLNGAGTDLDACDVAQLSYAWDLDGKAGYEFLSATPTNPAAISYNALKTVLGVGTHTVSFKVTDPSGAFATASTLLTISATPAAMIIAPANLSTLTGTSLTFTWNNASADLYQIYAGTTGAGSSNLGSFPVGGTTGTSTVLSGLPKNGSTVYVRLYSKFGANVIFNDYIYTATGPAVVSSPVSSSTLAGTSLTFTWNNVGADLYQIYAGTTGAGSSNLGSFPAGGTTGTSTVLSGLPKNGSTVYVRLYSKFGNEVIFSDSTYTATGPAVVSLPASTSTLTGTSQTFTWNNAGADLYQIYAGTTGAGSSNLGSFPAGGTTGTSTVLSGLPKNGSTVYVRLYSKFGNEVIFSDSTYTATGPAVVSAPVNSTTLTGTSKTFTWNNVGADLYQLYVGTTGAGSSNLGSFPAGGTAGISTVVSGLPIDGSTVYVRLYSKFGNEVIFSDSTYTATSPAALSVPPSPANGSTLAGTSHTFTWNDVGADLYQLYVGSTGFGSVDLGSFPTGGAISTSTVVSGVPTDGSTIYVRLYSKFGSTVVFNDYSFISGL